MGAEGDVELAGPQRWAAFHNETTGTPEASLGER
jgi:hypothetical protein